MENKKYIGQFCFMEQSLKTGSTYDNGEYFITEASPNCLYGIKPVGGYGAHESRAFPVVGEKPWTVISTYRDDERALRAATEMEYFADYKKRGEKSNWIEYVYEGARSNAAKIRRLVGASQSSSVTIAKIEITLSDGSIKSLSI